ncbi:NADH-ubiquinone oxidoreductase 21 subunit [Sphaceloma murrayae]|uniref:NADH-ubiquinone oxidoreductase 21 subunit n=1 Tax=Sphaceloma murrayae TaxID=2082308 RepID=A0A2K1QI19_9PEZI|nr:NADH-ubiquinone oxidoreductase 21 subunit [Sphaceloma murrayae]
MVADVAKIAVSSAAKAAHFKKYTVQPTGIWQRINSILAVDPSRSTGVPMNPQFRNPPPGALDPKEYDDPVTIPAGDIAENPYWKRDVRRSYPKLSVVKQSDVVALLTVGSAKSPKDDVLQLGDAGSKQLVAVKEEGERGLSSFLEKNKTAGVSVLGPGGLPPLPTTRSHKGPKRYDILQDQSYGKDASKYPCRTFA